MKNRLKSVTLINSGEYSFSTIDIDGNVLLSGANGAGKSTFLRTVLFFYNPSLKRTDFGIDSNKKSFLDYYFPYPESSYLLYEYVNQYGRNYALVYKTKKLRFRFFSIDNHTEIDLKSIFFLDGETLEPDRVGINFRKVSIGESDIFVGVEQFQKIIYGQEIKSKKSRKDEKDDVAKYTLYKANAEYQHIGNTIKNIFLNHKIDADSIKSLLVSNIDEMDRPSVQLEIVKGSIDKFLDKQENIEQFSKHIKVAESIAKSRNNYIELDEKQDKYLLNMINREYFVLEEQELLSVEMGKLDKSLDKEDKNKRLLEEIFLEKYQELNTVKGILKNKVEEAEKYLKSYHEKNIKEKLLKYDEIESLKINVLATQTEKDILVGKAENRVKAFDTEILIQNNKKVAIETDEKAEKTAHHETFLEERERLRELRDKEFEDKKKVYEKDEEKLISEQGNLKNAYQEKEKKLIEIQHTKFYESEILGVTNSLSSLKDEQTKLVSNSELLIGEIELLKVQIDSINMETKHQIQATNLKQNIKIDKIENKIAALNSKINFHPDSLIGFLDTHDLPHKNKIFSTVKDAVLTATNLNPRVIDESNTLYGIEIDAPLSGSLDELKEELKTLKEDKQKLVKEKESLILLIEEESKKVTSKTERQRGDKYKLKSEIDKKIPLLERKIYIKEESLKDLEEKAQIEKEKQEKLVQDDIKKLYKKIEEYQNSLDVIINKKKELKNEIFNKYILLEKDEERNKELKNKASENKKKQLLEACEDVIDSIKSRKEKVLKNEGISQEALDALELKIKELKKNIVTYQGYEKEINEYKFNHKPKIDKLDIWKKEFIEVEKVIVKENSIHLVNMKIIKDKLKAITTENTKYKNKHDGYVLELKYLKQLKDLDSDFSNRIDFLKQEQTPHIDKSYLTVTINEYQIHRSSLLRELNKCKSDLIEHVGKLFKKIDSPELLNLIPNRDNTLEEFLRVGFDVEIFLNEKKIEELIKETISLFNRATRQLTRDIEDIQKHTGNINTQLNRVRKGINDLSGISVIDEIDIRLQNSENRILLNLEKLKNIHDEYGMDYDENSGEGLFALYPQLQEVHKRTDKEKKADMEMMRLFKSLSESIEGYKKESLSLEECFEIEFKVSENNNESRWQSSLNGIGSEGTDVIVKILIYVSLLSLTKKESIDNEVDIHCLVDEIGKLSPHYFKEVIEFTNALGIYFINGMPSEMLVSSFKNHYKLRKIGAKKEKLTVATKIIYRVDEEDMQYEN